MYKGETYEGKVEGKMRMDKIIGGIFSERELEGGRVRERKGWR